MDILSHFVMTHQVTYLTRHVKLKIFNRYTRPLPSVLFSCTQFCCEKLLFPIIKVWAMLTYFWETKKIFWKKHFFFI